MKHYEIKDGKLIINTATMKKEGRSLFVGVPVISTIDPRVSARQNQLKDLLERHGLRCTIRYHVGNSLITLARDILAAEFMEAGFTDFLFLDSDIVFEPQDVLRMMAADLPVLGGLYPKKLMNWETIEKVVRHWAANQNLPFPDLETAGAMVTAQLMESPERIDFAVQVPRIATGFLLIQRKTLEKLHATFPELKYSLCNDAPCDSYVYELFRAAPFNKEPRGEDYYFCDLCTRAGIKVYADSLARLGHIGNHVYTCNPAQVLTPA